MERKGFYIDDDGYLVHDVSCDTMALVDSDHIEELSLILDSHDELLEACKAMYEALAILEGYDDITAKAKQAIANATNP